MPPVAARRRAPAPTAQAITLPAPVGGINAISPAAGMPPTDCVVLWNMTAAEYGLRVRLGSREWCTGLTGAADDLVRTVLPFTGSTVSGSKNRLFATTSSGIWDVTSSSAAPTNVRTFADTTGNAGYGVAHVVVTSAGHFLLYCDEVNGLYVYTESTDAWAKVAEGVGATQISGVNPASFCFVASFKGRVWFVQKDTATAWYLAAGSIFGAATTFPMGSKFKAGGHLVGLWNWTYDGGSGLDDALVAVSQGGDVLVWRGSDPAYAQTFSINGVWTVGPPPAGRNIGTTLGGDLLLLSRSGLIPMSRLVSGVALEPTQYATGKVSNLFNAAMLSKASLTGWSMVLHPEDASLVVTVPTVAATATEQLVMSLAAKSWSRYRGLPIYSAASWGGKLYYGTTDGKVGINDGYVDGVTLSDPNAYSPVAWSLVTAFQNLGSPRQKQVQLIKPTFLSESATVAYGAEARYRYDFTEATELETVGSGLAAWDSGVWDSAVWAGEYSPTQQVGGAVGIGSDVAIALRGQSTVRTILAGVDVVFTVGGLL